jgi:hypothetical protein
MGPGAFRRAGGWGLRFVLHRGEERALSRMIFAVIAVALGSVFAATHVPGADWPHPAIGLGGLFGDTVLGAVLTLLPVGTGTGLKVMSLGFGAATVAFYLFVTGFDTAELRALGRFVMHGTITLYAMALTLAGRGAAGTARAAAAALQDRRASLAARSSARQAEMAAAPSAAMPAEPPLFGKPAALKAALSDEALEENARMLESVLDDYGVKGEIVSRPPRPRRHDVRTGTRAGPEGQPRDRPGRRHRAVDVGAVGARLDRAGPVGDRDRTAQRRAREGRAARDPVGPRLRRQPDAPAAGAGQGHRRRSGRGEPRQDAPPADRRHHRARASRWRSTR